MKAVASFNDEYRKNRKVNVYKGIEDGKEKYWAMEEINDRYSVETVRYFDDL